MLAIKAGHLAIVQALVAKRARLNTKAPTDFVPDRLMVLPLTWVEMNRHKDIAAFLKKKGRARRARSLARATC
jgi:hypothetical protein